MNMQTLTLPLDAFLLSLGEEPLHTLRTSFKTFSLVRRRPHHHPAATITVMGRADFMHHIALHMPEVSSQIDEDDFGILHLEMGAMRLATRAAIRRYEFYTVRRHFSFISYLLEHADRDLHDAIVVSYLEGLFIDETSVEFKSVRALLPGNLKDALKKTELRYASMATQIIKYPRS